MDMSVIAFYIFALVAVVASIGVVGQRNPMYSVMLLITSFGALAGLYVLLDAPFSAVTQIIIYAGAIMVLFLFVVMLLNVPREEPAFGLAATLGAQGLKIGAVLFGSGYVLLAFLRADFVDRLGWLTEGQLMDAIAVGQFTPGPLFTTATALGVLGSGTRLAYITAKVPDPLRASYW